jgi:hypothetical protein
MDTDPNDQGPPGLSALVDRCGGRPSWAFFRAAARLGPGGLSIHRSREPVDGANHLIVISQELIGRYQAARPNLHDKISDLRNDEPFTTREALEARAQYCWSIYARVRSSQEDPAEDRGWLTTRVAVTWSGTSRLAANTRAPSFFPSPRRKNKNDQLNHDFARPSQGEGICPVFLMYRDTWYFLQILCNSHHKTQQLRVRR